MDIRFATKKDIPAIKELFRSTILSVNLKDYTPEQVGCCAPRGEDVSVWEEQINEQYFILAEEYNTIQYNTRVCCPKIVRVFKLCTGNSCRSQMAHGFLQSFDPSLSVYTAGCIISN